MVLFDQFFEKISPLKSASKLGVVLIQLAPSFTIKEFRTTNFQEYDQVRKPNLMRSVTQAWAVKRNIKEAINELKTYFFL